MAELKCKSCQKPLISGRKCDACKQIGSNKIKKIAKGVGTGALALAAVTVPAALSALFNKKDG